MELGNATDYGTGKKNYATVRSELLQCGERLGEHCSQLTEADLNEQFTWRRKQSGPSRRPVLPCGRREALVQYLPIVAAYRRYKPREDLLPDLLTGIVAGVAAVPIGMSFALIAGARPEAGLYCQLIYPLPYFLLSSSENVVLGTSAVEAMLVNAAVARIYRGVEKISLEMRAHTHAWLGLMVGVNLICGRFLGAPVIANFLSDSVVSGFSTGCAAIIAFSQLPAVLGVSPPAGIALGPLPLALHLIGQLRKVNPAAVLMTFTSLTLLFLADLISRRTKVLVPGAAVLLAACIPLSYWLDLSREPYLLQIVGRIKPGFPRPNGLKLEWDLLGDLYLQSVLYTVIWFFCHISVVRAVERRHDRCDSSSGQEMLATGAASVLGAFLQCYPCATSMARTAIVCNGAKTRFFHITNAIVILLAIGFMTPVLAYLPLSALAALVLFSLPFMLSFGEAKRLYKLRSPDFIFWIISFTITVGAGAVPGILCAVGLSLVWLVKGLALPPTGTLGRLPNTRIFRRVADYPEAEEIPGIKIIYFNAPLSFCNAESFERAVLTAAGLRPPKSGLLPTVRALSPGIPCNASPVPVENSSPVPEPQAVQVVIVDASSIHHIDATALRMVESLAIRMEIKKKLLCFANWRGPAKRFLDKTDFGRWVPPERCFHTLHEAAICAQRYFLTTCETLAVDGVPEAVYPAFPVRQISRKNVEAAAAACSGRELAAM